VLEEYKGFVDDASSPACSISSSSNSRLEFSSSNGIPSEITPYVSGALLSFSFVSPFLKLMRFQPEKSEKTAAFYLFPHASNQMKAFLAKNAMGALHLGGKTAELKNSQNWHYVIYPD